MGRVVRTLKPFANPYTANVEQMHFKHPSTHVTHTWIDDLSFSFGFLSFYPSPPPPPTPSIPPPPTWLRRRSSSTD